MSQAVEQYRGGTALAVGEINERQWNQLERKAKVFANTKLTPERWQGKDKEPEIMAVGLTLYSLGVDLTLSTLNQCYVISGQVQMMAQLQIGIADSHGIDCWFEPDDVSETEATISIRKHGATRVDRYRYTIEMARKNHLLDEFVERWVPTQSGKKYPERIIISVDGVPTDAVLPDWAQKQVEQGKVKRKDPWFNSRQQMLMARATTLGLKVAAPSVLLGLPSPDFADPVAEPVRVADSGPRPSPTTSAAAGEPFDLDEEPIDAELVDDKEPGGAAPPSEEGEEDGIREDPSVSTAAVADGGDSEGPPLGPSEAPASDASATDEERQRIRVRLDELGPAWKNAIALEWRKQKLPYLDREALTHGHVQKVHVMLDSFVERKKDAELRRQKHVNAELGEIGIKGDAERHAFISAATNGETESSAGLTGPQTKAIQEAVDRRKAELASAAREDQASGTSQESMPWDDDDPGRPFDDGGRRGD